MSDFYDQLTAQCKSSVVDLNTIASQMGINSINTMTATSARSDSYTHTTTTGNYYGNTVSTTYTITVPPGMLPGSGLTSAWPGNPDVPSRQYIHDQIYWVDHWDQYEMVYDDHQGVSLTRCVWRSVSDLARESILENFISEIQDIYRAKTRGEDTDMPIHSNMIITSEEFKKMFGYDPHKPVEGSVYPTPKPVKVETYNDRVVKVTFEDGSFTKSVCSDNDTFDLDVGITICILKRVMGKNGHKLYNNMMRDIHKIMDENEKEKEKARKDKAERKAKQRKTELKAAAKKAKARQDQIDIQKTAFVEALRASGIGSGDDLK